MTDEDVMVGRVCAEMETRLARAREKVAKFQQIKLKRPLNGAELSEIGMILSQMEVLTEILDDLLAVKAAPGH